MEGHGQAAHLPLPNFILDTPGGFGKVPLSPNYVVASDGARTTLRTPRGVVVDYLDPEPPPGPPR